MQFRLPVAREMVRVNPYKVEPETLKGLHRALTFTLPSAYLSRGLADAGAPVCAYQQEPDTGVLLLPRHTPWVTFGLPRPVPVARPYQRLVDVSATRPLREGQQEPFDALLDRLHSRRDGILSLACGKGKTVLAVTAWAAYGMPGLAIVPTLQIADQWVQRLLEFTTLGPDEIGQLGGGRSDWDKPFVVATIQTISQKRFPEKFYQRFGVVFYDEVHRLGAPLFSTTGGLFNATRIGLSATWKRADGLEQLFMLHVGPVFYEDHAQELTPQIFFVPTETRLDLGRYRMWGRRGDINYARVLTALSRDEPRQALVLGLLREATAEGRKVLVLGDRKEELVTYEEELTRMRIGAGVCVGSLDGRVMAQATRTAALQQQVTLATSQLVKEGLDQPDFDTILILYPKSNAAFAEQAVGRILRRHAGKGDPVVVVLQDHHCTFMINGKVARPFTGQCRTMERCFRALKYSIRQPPMQEKTREGNRQEAHVGQGIRVHQG